VTIADSWSDIEGSELTSPMLTAAAWGKSAASQIAAEWESRQRWRVICDVKVV